MNTTDLAGSPARIRKALCSLHNSATEFQLKFRPKRRRQPKWLTDDTEEVEEESNPFTSLGLVHVCTSDGQMITVFSARYREYVQLLGTLKCWPVDQTKDRAFKARMRSGKPHKNFPWHMFVSTNGCEPAALMDLRKKLPKKL